MSVPRHPILTRPWAARISLWLAALGIVSAPGAELAIDQKDGPVRLTLNGDDGKEYSVEALESLLNAGAVWKSVATVAPRANRPSVLLDPTCSTQAQNFYRLRLLQGAIPVEAPNFRLVSLDGEAHELFYQSDAQSVVLLLAGPDLTAMETLAPGLPAHLRSLAATYGPRGVRFWVLVEAASTDRPRTRAQADALGWTRASGITVLEDEGGAVLRSVGSGTVPEAIALEPASWSIAYRGRLHDRVTSASGHALEHALLAEALEARLAGTRAAVRHTAPLGREIPSAPAEVYSAPTGTLAMASPSTPQDGIVDIFVRRCMPCHTEGGIAPFSMADFHSIAERAPLIKDEILTRRMPPWNADRQAQAYANDAMLTPGELSRLVAWIDRGAPRGDGPDRLATAARPPLTAWPLGEPDRVIRLQPQSIPASGTVDYRYLVVPNPFPADVWLRAAALRPGNPAVVHHVIVFSASSFADILQVQGGLGGYFAAYVPGMDQVPFPEGTGKLLKRGAFLVFQMHYTATGKPETDTTELGLYLAPGKPAAELRTAAGYTTSFNIPPGAANHPATAEFTLPFDAILHEMSPHMHYRGRWFRFEAVFPDARRETLLHVPFYRFDWQTLYRLREPKRLPAGTRIVMHGGWDNSARNPFNPDPGASVGFGEQSWEEMFIGYFNFSPAP